MSTKIKEMSRFLWC